MGATMIATTSSARLEQRMEALERANEIRSLRAQLKRDLKGGRKAIEEVLSRPADYLATMTILDLLIWTPKRKRIRASQVLRRCQITPSRTVGALTERQREIIIAELRRPGSVNGTRIALGALAAASLLTVACSTTPATSATARRPAASGRAANGLRYSTASSEVVQATRLGGRSSGGCWPA